MSAKSTWYHVATLNDISTIMSEDEKKRYNKRMNKWASSLEKMKPNKPKFAAKPAKKEEEEEV